MIRFNSHRYELSKHATEKPRMFLSRMFQIVKYISNFASFITDPISILASLLSKGVEVRNNLRKKLPEE